MENKSFETRLNKQVNTPIKINGEEHPESPRSRGNRSLEKRRKSSEGSANNVDVQTPKSARRSVRISAKRKSVENENVLNEIEELDDDETVENDVPTNNFFSENPDSHSTGQEIYSFKTPKKKGAMVSLAYNTPKGLSLSKAVGTPKTPGTPKSSRKSIQAKTPKHVRTKFQKGNSFDFTYVTIASQNNFSIETKM